MERRLVSNVTIIDDTLLPDSATLLLPTIADAWNDESDSGAAAAPQQSSITVGGAFALVFALIFIGLVITYPWWRPKIPCDSFCGCCPCIVPIRRAKDHDGGRMNDCGEFIRMAPTTTSHPPARCTRTFTSATDSRANRESFWSADAGADESGLSQQSAETLDISACTVQDAASTSIDQGLPFPLRFRPDGEPDVQHIPM